MTGRDRCRVFCHAVDSRIKNGQSDSDVLRLVRIALIDCRLNLWYSSEIQSLFDVNRVRNFSETAKNDLIYALNYVHVNVKLPFIRQVARYGKDLGTGFKTSATPMTMPTRSRNFAKFEDRIYSEGLEKACELETTQSLRMMASEMADFGTFTHNIAWYGWFKTVPRRKKLAILSMVEGTKSGLFYNLAKEIFLSPDETPALKCKCLQWLKPYKNRTRNELADNKFVLILTSNVFKTRVDADMKGIHIGFDEALLMLLEADKTKAALKALPDFWQDVFAPAVEKLP